MLLFLLMLDYVVSFTSISLLFLDFLYPLLEYDAGHQQSILGSSGSQYLGYQDYLYWKCRSPGRLSFENVTITSSTNFPGNNARFHQFFLTQDQFNQLQSFGSTVWVYEGDEFLKFNAASGFEEVRDYVWKNNPGQDYYFVIANRDVNGFHPPSGATMTVAWDYFEYVPKSTVALAQRLDQPFCENRTVTFKKAQFASASQQFAVKELGFLPAPSFVWFRYKVISQDPPVERNLKLMTASNFQDWKDSLRPIPGPTFPQENFPYQAVVTVSTSYFLVIWANETDGQSYGSWRGEFRFGQTAAQAGGKCPYEQIPTAAPTGAPSHMPTPQPTTAFPSPAPTPAPPAGIFLAMPNGNPSEPIDFPVNRWFYINVPAGGFLSYDRIRFATAFGWGVNQPTFEIFLLTQAEYDKFSVGSTFQPVLAEQAAPESQLDPTNWIIPSGQSNFVLVLDNSVYGAVAPPLSSASQLYFDFIGYQSSSGSPNELPVGDCGESTAVRGPWQYKTRYFGWIPQSSTREFAFESSDQISAQIYSNSSFDALLSGELDGGVPSYDTGSHTFTAPSNDYYVLVLFANASAEPLSTGAFYYRFNAAVAAGCPGHPTRAPTLPPSASPTNSPSSRPTSAPSAAPSSQPSRTPTASPSMQPSQAPSNSPSAMPSASPTVQPTATPTSLPTMSPIIPGEPTPMPTSPFPTASPSPKPSAFPTVAPSRHPSKHPTVSPSAFPTATPSFAPTLSPPTLAPSPGPTGLGETPAPSLEPSAAPTVEPSAPPTVGTPAPATLPPEKECQFGPVADRCATKDLQVGAEFRADCVKVNGGDLQILESSLLCINALPTKDDCLAALGHLHCSFFCQECRADDVSWQLSNFPLQSCSSVCEEITESCGACSSELFSFNGVDLSCAAQSSLCSDIAHSGVASTSTTSLADTINTGSGGASSTSGASSTDPAASTTVDPNQLNPGDNTSPASVGGGLDDGIIALIVVLIVICIIVLIAIAFCVIRRKRKKDTASDGDTNLTAMALSDSSATSSAAKHRSVEEIDYAARIDAAAEAVASTQGSRVASNVNTFQPENFELADEEDGDTNVAPPVPGATQTGAARRKGGTAKERRKEHDETDEERRRRKEKKERKKEKARLRALAAAEAEGGDEITSSEEERRRIKKEKKRQEKEARKAAKKAAALQENDYIAPDVKPHKKKPKKHKKLEDEDDDVYGTSPSIVRTETIEGPRVREIQWLE